MTRYLVPTIPVAVPDMTPLVLVLWALAGLVVSAMLLPGSDADWLLN